MFITPAVKRSRCSTCPIVGPCVARVLSGEQDREEEETAMAPPREELQMPAKMARMLRHTLAAGVVSVSKSMLLLL